MSVPVTTLRTHLAHAAWATSRILEAARALPPELRSRQFGTADKDVDGTLGHILWADRLWLARVQNGPKVPYVISEYRDFDFICREWPRVFEGWRDWAAGLTDASVLDEVSYEDSRGNSWKTPRWQIILHVVNHGTHHRGQVAGFIRSLGYEPPPLDLIRYYREPTLH